MCSATPRMKENTSPRRTSLPASVPRVAMTTSRFACLALLIAGVLDFTFSLLFFRDEPPQSLRDLLPSHGRFFRGGHRSLDGAGNDKHLAVVVPLFDGDIDEAYDSLSTWPSQCYPVTRRSVDLILYKAEAEDEKSKPTLKRLADSAGRCFAQTKVVYGALTKEENVYPDGPSVQFYKMFLDEDVKRQFTDYDVIAIIERDVLIAHESSFAQLYQSAFHGGEAYWVKGSVLAGTNFHETATKTNMWHVLGHINGNALYNNTDPAFVEFIDYTRIRWKQPPQAIATEKSAKYIYPYDVALWATIADFPYSWPLWQRFSDKFINTHLIANVGFMDVDHTTVSHAVEQDTLFIHGSATAGGSKKFAGDAREEALAAAQAAGVAAGAGGDTRAIVCTAACSDEATLERLSPGMSRVCDPTCLAGEQGIRFNGYMCGSGNPNVYGEGCRTCYTDEKVAAEHEERLWSHSNGGKDGKHVIMCDTMRPPSGSRCSIKCNMKLDTVCDHTCGAGRFGDYNCNWRDRGTQCRYCFNDVHQALNADEIARKSGGRVIMCDTHEPPRAPADMGMNAVINVNAVEAKAAVKVKKQSAKAAPIIVAPPMIPFSEDIVRGELCAFVPGYFRFIDETEVTARSVVQFMRGMRVVVAVHSTDFHVFDSAFGDLPGVRIVETSHVSVSSLLADQFCGAGTKLIYYLNPGELLSRPIVYKDTHSPRGDLLVVYSDQQQETAAVLGFSSPSFGGDIVLPATINAQLRTLVLAGHGSKEDQGDVNDAQYAEQLLANTASDVSVPQLLAAVAYARNPPGLWFFNPAQWVTHHLFKDASVWDIPLVKLRFGCMLDMSLSLRGYDMGLALRNTLDHFQAGISCETGFLEVDETSLVPKPTIEFSEATGKEVPGMADYRVSVLYDLLPGQEGLVEISLASVVQHFPTALEVVIVAGNDEKHAFDALLANYTGDDVPFPVKLVTDDLPTAASLVHSADRMETRTRSIRRLTADQHCQGDFVLHLDPTSVLFADVTYDAVFHFGHPVIPYSRHPEGEWDRLVECREVETARVFDEPVVHHFSTFGTVVYPRAMYANLRSFVADMHNARFKDVMARRDRSWAIPGPTKSCSSVEREFVLPDFEFMGAFMWNEMHDQAYWLATDPLDKSRDDWAADLYEFAWICSAVHAPRLAREDPSKLEEYMKELEGVDSPFSCFQLNTRWQPKSRRLSHDDAGLDDRFKELSFYRLRG